MHSNLQSLDFVSREATRPLAVVSGTNLSFDQVARQVAVVRIRVASLLVVVKGQLADTFDQLLLLFLCHVFCDVFLHLLASYDQDLLRRSVYKRYDFICKRTDLDFIWTKA